MDGINLHPTWRKRNFLATAGQVVGPLPSDSGGRVPWRDLLNSAHKGRHAFRYRGLVGCSRSGRRCDDAVGIVAIAAEAEQDSSPVNLVHVLDVFDQTRSLAHTEDKNAGG